MDILHIILNLLALYAGVGIIAWVQNTRDYCEMTPEERLYYYDHADYKIGFALGMIFICIVAWPWAGKGDVE